jgi:serine/threonine-protein kinase RsbT
MTSTKSKPLPLLSCEDIVRVRQTTRSWMVEQRFSLVEQTKMMTAVSELARNAVVYGGGGSATLELLEECGRRGIRVVVEDQGPGIADIEQAMTDHFTSGQGMGLGLGGAKRLVDQFEIWSEPGKGTVVCITRWK